MVGTIKPTSKAVREVCSLNFIVDVPGGAHFRGVPTSACGGAILDAGCRGPALEEEVRDLLASSPELAARLTLAN
jgi:hypothetical protein